MFASALLRNRNFVIVVIKRTTSVSSIPKVSPGPLVSKMPPQEDRERRDWSLPVKETLPCLKTTVIIEEDFEVIEKPEDEEDEPVESNVPEKKLPEPVISEPEPEPKKDEKNEKDKPAESKSLFVDMMLEVAARTKTENAANAYSTTLNANLDLFASVVPDTSSEEVFRLLNASWAQDPNLTLRCIFHMRDIRHGKSDAFKFSDSLYWLYKNHPKTLVENLRHVPKTGYWKDLLNFLVRIVVGEDEYQEEVERIKECDRTKKARQLQKKANEKKWQEALEKAKAVWDTWKDEPAGESGLRKRPVFSILYKKDLKEDPDTNPLTNKEWSARSQKRRRWLHKKVEDMKNGVPPRDPEEVRKEKIARDQKRKHDAALLRRAKRREQAKKACDVFSKDDVYRAVHIEVARLFAGAMTKDLEKMKKSESNPEEAKKPKKENFCSLAPKWAPSLNNWHDKTTHIATTISQILFQDEKGSYETSTVGVSYLRDRYRKEYVTPLRKYMKVVETMLGYGLCREIAYNTVPALSMRRNRPLFERLDGERFDQYLKDVKDGKTTIAASALKPHELVREILRENEDSSDESDESDKSDGESLSEDEEAGDKAKAEAKKEKKPERDREDEVRELQWASYRDRLTKTGKLDRVMPIVDVSGSMEGEPMEVAIALGMLCAEVSKPPYNKLICTFSETPEFFKVDQPTLREKVQAVSKMNWGMNTNFEAVFDLILQRALATKLPPEEMISLLIVFSDMEFDQARSGGSGDWTVLHDLIAHKFQLHGYTLPAIVYWNLRGGNYFGGRTQCTFPVLGNQKGVALVSGFSGQMLKLFMDGDLNFDPVKLMNKALNRYKFVTVVD